MTAAEEAQAQVEVWNTEVPIGTRVVGVGTKDGTVEWVTKGRAFLLDETTPAVVVEWSARIVAGQVFGVRAFPLYQLTTVRLAP